MIHSLLEWVVVEREEKKKAGKSVSPLLAGTESVSAWVGRVAERAKQAPGISSVGVRMGGERRGGLNPKWQSGSLRVGVDGEHIHVCASRMIVQCDY